MNRKQTITVLDGIIDSLKNGTLEEVATATDDLQKVVDSLKDEW
jgi:hypothetical protein